MSAKTLVIRMSSLGDVILASAALEALRKKDIEIHWLIHSDYADVLRGHPLISKLIVYDRDPKLSSWLRFCLHLVSQEGPGGPEGYASVLDLHGSIRSFILRLVFLWKGRARGLKWSGVSKSRWSTWGRYVFKNLFPVRPPTRIEAFSRAAGGDGSERPQLEAVAALHRGTVGAGLEAPYFCVMPSSRWSGKEWPAAKYASVLEEFSRKYGDRCIPVIMGRQSDPNSRDLLKLLTEKGMDHVSGVGRWSLGEVAAVLRGGRFYFGADTGLAHLAEAVGTPAVMLFVPGVPDLGFGPWRPLSATVSPKLWCRPCGKDGRYCHRIIKRHECMNVLHPGTVFLALEEQVKHVLGTVVSAVDRKAVDSAATQSL